jgi:hypothetical protein
VCRREVGKTPLLLPFLQPTEAGSWTRLQPPWPPTRAPVVRCRFVLQFPLTDAALSAAPIGPGAPLSVDAGLSLPLDSGVVLFAPSPSGRRTLVVRGGGSGNDKAGGGDSCTVELWGGAGVEFELAVPSALHGAVFNDGWFSTGAAWSPDETKLVYVAEVRVRGRCAHASSKGF